MSKVLVTGSAGFLGKNLVEFLKKKSFEVSEFDKKEGQDLLREKDLKKALKNVDFICHLAAVGDIYLAAENPVEAAISGVAGTVNLVKLTQKYQIKKIVYASTWEVYGKPVHQPIDENHPTNPDHPYSISKLAGELMIRSKLFNIPWVILRLGTAYGPHMRQNAVIPVFINLAKSGKPIKIFGTGSQTRAFVHAKDIANAFYLALTKKVENEIFNITSSESTSILDLAKLVTKYFPTKIESAPARAADVSPAKVTSEKAAKILGWKQIVKFKDGFEKLIKDYK